MEQEEHSIKSGPVYRCSLKATEPPEAGKKLFGDRVPEQAEGLSSNCRAGNGCPQMSKLAQAVPTGSHGSQASVTSSEHVGEQEPGHTLGQRTRSTC